MIVVRLMGGLGNQMFQYALGRRLALQLDTPLKCDLRYLESQRGGATPRSLMLDRLNATFDRARESDLERFFPDRMTRLARKLTARRDFSIQRERGMRFDPEVLEASTNTYLIGYWQTERYFAPIADTLRRELAPLARADEANTAILAQIARTNSVSVHIRRGDYVGHPFHDVVRHDYYVRAVRAMCSYVDDPHLFVFSDEPQWCRDNLAFEIPAVVVDVNAPDSAENDMRLMAACRHHIIANSSFSWWAAWLNPRPDKVVIAPERWAEPKDADFEDIFCEGWVRL